MLSCWKYSHDCIVNSYTVDQKVRLTVIFGPTVPTINFCIMDTGNIKLCIMDTDAAKEFTYAGKIL